MSKRAEGAETLEREFRPLAAAYGGCDVDGRSSGLADGMLGGGRNFGAGHSLDGSAVAQRPDLAFVIGQLQAGIDDELAALLEAIEFLNDWR